MSLIVISLWLLLTIVSLTTGSVNPNSRLVGPNSFAVIMQIFGRKNFRPSQVPTGMRTANMSPAMIAATIGCSNNGTGCLLREISTVSLTRHASGNANDGRSLHRLLGLSTSIFLLAELFLCMSASPLLARLSHQFSPPLRRGVRRRGGRSPP